MWHSNYGDRRRKFPPEPDVDIMELAFQWDNEFHQCQDEDCKAFLPRNPCDVEPDRNLGVVRFHYYFQCGRCGQTSTYYVRIEEI